MKKTKVYALIVLTLLLTAFLSLTVYAGRWEHDGYGWKFVRNSGEYATNIMLEIDDKWYAFDKYGHMMSNQWVMADGQWHYLTYSGAVATNQWIDNKYYVGSDGVMLTSTWTPDGYYVNELGEWDPSKSRKNQSTDIPDEYYTIDGNWDNRDQAGYRADYRVDAWIELNPSDDYLATMDFGLYTPNGTGYSLYDRSDPNGDSLSLATADGLEWGCRSTIDDEWYTLTYDGKDTIVLEWMQPTWAVSRRLVFKRRSGGRKLNYWSGGGVG